MIKKLFIVESPAKAKTINNYLGSEFIVIASYGHVRELPKKNGSIDVNNNFKPNFQNSVAKKKYIDAILSNGRQCDEIYLATDPDREGEAIAWHIKEILLSDKKIAKKPIKRVSFNEITKTAIINSIMHPRALDENLIEAQQARLSLDYLIGFNISPLLWRKIRRGLSAGRVQSPALRLICEREDEIKKFVPEDYFTVLLHFQKENKKLIAKLIEYNKEKIDTKTINIKEKAIEICESLDKSKTAQVQSVTKKQRKKNPLPPFITSSLQIDASRKFGFNPDKTMKVAQSLYEGVDIGNETVGLISYMRTDSVNLSVQALDEIREYIATNYEKKYLPDSPVKYISKVKNAQEAHEAIRPTAIIRTPEVIKKYLTSDQFDLYQLIWLRTVACQMTNAVLDVTAIDLVMDKAKFRINGLVVNFDGFMRVYNESKEDVSALNADEDEMQLPKMAEGEVVNKDKIDYTEHQTEPKPRFSEASLVKALEEFGIGRPSTYASIISTLKKREYVIVDKKRLIPTEIGDMVSQFLTKHLTNYVDLQFTANLEDTLDEISNGKIGKIPVLEHFWHELETIVAEKQGVARSELTAEKLDEKCPECSKDLLIKLGKYGRFVGCSGYPDCNYMRKLVDGNANTPPPEKPELVEGRLCPRDEGELFIRSGKYGKFISCGNYPKCKYIENMNKENDADSIKCPECTEGYIVSKRNRYGNWFYACDNYPKCKTLFNHKPFAKQCPKCEHPLLIHKITKRYGEQEICPKCDYCENFIG